MMPGPVLPPWIDRARPLAGVVLAIVPAYLIFILYYGGNPRTLAVGYQPEQPVPYSHALHAGELGIDCRYCHNTVEKGRLRGRAAHGHLHELPRDDRRRTATSWSSSAKAPPAARRSIG